MKEPRDCRRPPNMQQHSSLGRVEGRVVLVALLRLHPQLRVELPPRIQQPLEHLARARLQVLLKLLQTDLAVAVGIERLWRTVAGASSAGRGGRRARNAAALSGDTSQADTRAVVPLATQAAACAGA